MSEEKKFVSLYVSEAKAAEYEKLKGTVHDDDIIQQYIDKTKRCIETDFDALEDDLLTYKSSVSKWHKALKGAYEDQNEKTEALFLKFDAQKPSLHKKIKALEESVQPLESMIDNINKKLNKLDTWKVEKIIEVIHKLSSMGDEEREMLKILLGYEKQ